MIDIMQYFIVFVWGLFECEICIGIAIPSSPRIMEMP